MEGDTTYKIVTALFTLGMLVMIWPRARRMMKESRGGTGAEWMSVVVPLLAVLAFVVLLILSV